MKRMFAALAIVGITVLFLTVNFIKASEPKIDEPLLSENHISGDIDLLVDTLNEVYAGKEADPENFSILINNLNQIKSMHLGKIGLYQQIQVALEKFPDGHLQSAFGEVQYKVSRTMTSLPEKERSIEDTRFQEINTNGKNVLVVKIPTFLIVDPTTKQIIIDELTEKSKKADTLILDLRGNLGGYQDLVHKIGAVLWGEPYREDAIIQYYHTPISKHREWYNKPIHKLRLNLMQAQHIRNEYVFAVEENLNDPDAIFADASVEVHNEFTEDEMYIEKNGFAKPIYVLVDGQCASACELMLDAIEMHPYATSVGTTTVGAIKYQNPVMLTLPTSSIHVFISTAYIEYFDKRNIERKGYKPEIFLSEDEDAMKKALSLVK